VRTHSLAPSHVLHTSPRKPTSSHRQYRGLDQGSNPTAPTARPDFYYTRLSRLAQITTSADQMPISRSSTFTHIHPRACLHPGPTGGTGSAISPIACAQSLSSEEKWGTGASSPCSRAHPRNCIIVICTPDVRESLCGR
jgi:hypothetical protein